LPPPPDDAFDDVELELDPPHAARYSAALALAPVVINRRRV
jgi:hypothetical protein